MVRARGLPFVNRYLCETGRAVEPLGGSPPVKLHVWRQQRTIGRQRKDVDVTMPTMCVLRCKGKHCERMCVGGRSNV